jgi:hypothetical protein
MLRRSLNVQRDTSYQRAYAGDSVPFLTGALRSRFNPVVLHSEQVETIKWHRLQSVVSS